MAPKRDGTQMPPYQPAHPLPKTTAEAVERLLGLIPLEEQRRIAATPEEAFRIFGHFGLGLWIRNHFIHPGNPELCAACQAEHPDQVSAAILDVLWERLHDAPPAEPGQKRVRSTDENRRTKVR